MTVRSFMKKDARVFGMHEAACTRRLRQCRAAHACLAAARECVGGSAIRPLADDGVLAMPALVMITDVGFVEPSAVSSEGLESGHLWNSIAGFTGLLDRAAGGVRLSFASRLARSINSSAWRRSSSATIGALTIVDTIVTLIPRRCSAATSERKLPSPDRKSTRLNSSHGSI